MGARVQIKIFLKSKLGTDPDLALINFLHFILAQTKQSKKKIRHTSIAVKFWI